MAINKEFRVKHGLISEDDVIVNDSVTATSFIGDGSQLTGISSFSGNYNDLTNKPTLFSGSLIIDVLMGVGYWLGELWCGWGDHIGNRTEKRCKVFPYFPPDGCDAGVR